MYKIGRGPAQEGYGKVYHGIGQVVELLFERPESSAKSYRGSLNTVHQCALSIVFSSFYCESTHIASTLGDWPTYLLEDDLRRVVDASWEIP